MGSQGAPMSTCVKIPAACAGQALPTCACAGATVGYCSFPEACTCTESASVPQLVCNCGAP
jgi:hypothetical protein